MYSMQKVHVFALNSVVAFPRCSATGFTAVANTSALETPVKCRHIDTYRHRQTDRHIQKQTQI